MSDLHPLICIGSHTFKNTTAAQAFVRSTLERIYQESEEGDILHDHPDFGFLLALTQRHARFEEKKGAGIHAFAILSNSKHGKGKGLELNIRTIDNQLTSVSWLKCAHANGFKPEQELHANLNSAFRQAINDQIRQFRQQLVYPLSCKLCLKECAAHETHVDHEKEFSLLVDEFQAMYQGAMPTRFDKELESHKAMFTKTDEALSRSWSSFHIQHATLRLLCGPCNLKRSKPQSEMKRKKHATITTEMPLGKRHKASTPEKQ